MEEFDLISSNGLNIYVKEKEQVIALYQKFFDALKAWWRSGDKLLNLSTDSWGTLRME